MTAVMRSDRSMSIGGGGSAAADAENRRWATRKPSVIAGRLVCEGFSEEIPCVIRDMSATGARLAVEPKRFGPLQSTLDLPERFVLVIRNDQTEVDCRLAWRSVDNVGVRFLSAIRPTPYRVATALRKRA